MIMTRRDVLRLALATAGLVRCTISAGAGRRPAPGAARRHAQALAPLARVQPARQVHGRPAKAVRGARLRRHRRAGLRLRPAAAGLPMLDRPRESHEAQGAGPQGDRPGGRARPQARHSRPDQLPPGARIHRRQARRSRSRSGPMPEIQEVCAPPLGELRRALSGHAQQPGQLQPAQRARRQGQARGPPPRGRARRRSDPQPRSGPADRLRRPCLGDRAARPS